MGLFSSPVGKAQAVLAAVTPGLTWEVHNFGPQIAYAYLSREARQHLWALDFEQATAMAADVWQQARARSPQNVQIGICIEADDGAFAGVNPISGAAENMPKGSRG